VTATLTRRGTRECARCHQDRRSVDASGFCFTCRGAVAAERQSTDEVPRGVRGKVAWNETLLRHYGLGGVGETPVNYSEDGDHDQRTSA
jgi:hypothetical protein